MRLLEAFFEILERPSVGAIVIGMLQVLGLVWVPFFLGIIVGWAWKPRWVDFRKRKLNFSASSSLVQGLASTQTSGSSTAERKLDNERVDLVNVDSVVPSSSAKRKDENAVITNEDLVHLRRLVERKDGDPPWKHMMERSTHNMSYQAWQRDPENCPPQYCSRTVYEDATPELMRDFFWDDEFRMKWDDMLIHAEIIEECPSTGTMIVHWIKKFPFFCSNREYIIGRRIWELGRSYYCVTKGVPCSSIPRKDKPRRVDLCYSSWYIQAVESRKKDGELSACEVILFHFEDMGIPWEIARFGVRQGMWGTVRNIDRGFRAYQKARLSGAPICHHALMAQVNTKIDPDHMKGLEGDEKSRETQILDSPEERKGGINIPKFLIIGGAIVIGCSLDRGLLTKPLIFGLARTFGSIGKRACPRAN